MDPTRGKHNRSHSQSTGHGPVAHSTPSKASKSLRFADKPLGADGGHDVPDGASLPPTRFVFRRDLQSSSNSEQQFNTLSEMERDTIIKQRTELHLLISELRDRDKELNDMVQAHHTEMKAWQEDRSLTQTLEQKCAKLERDLNKRNSQIRELLKKFKAVEGEALDSSSALENSRHHLQNLEEDHKTVCQQLRELEEYNSKLQQSHKDASQSLGDTESKVLHLQHHLQVKEKEAVVTNKEVTDLASRLQSLEFSYKQLEKITFEVKTSANEWKNKYTDVKQTADGLRNELDISNATAEEKDEELERLRRLLRERQEELAYTVEREKRKDQMLLLQKSKQERTDTELCTLRQMYDLQQHKLAATRKELNEVKEKDMKYKCSLEDSSVFDLTNGSMSPTANQSPRRNGHSPPRRHISPIGDRAAGNSYVSRDVVSLEAYRDVDVSTGVSSTDRLQRLLSDSKRLVDTITSNESKSPTHLIAQLSTSAEDR